FRVLLVLAVRNPRERVPFANYPDPIAADAAGRGVLLREICAVLGFGEREMDNGAYRCAIVPEEREPLAVTRNHAVENHLAGPVETDLGGPAFVGLLLFQLGVHEYPLVEVVGPKRGV